MRVMRYLKFLAFTFVLVLLCLFGDQGFFKLQRLRAAEQRLKQENFEMADKNTKLQEEVVRLKDSHYLEKMIHERMGYVKPDEIVIELGSP